MRRLYGEEVFRETVQESVLRKIQRIEETVQEYVLRKIQRIKETSVLEDPQEIRVIHMKFWTECQYKL